MAEPFSVAGSAFGVISLGLTVSQGFLANYGPYKSFHEEIETVTTRMEALKRISRVIQTLMTEANRLNRPSVAQSTQIATNTILSCESALQRLQGMLDRCCASTPPRRLPMAEVKAHVNQLLYPFRRETLMSVIENVSWLQDNLNTSLQMLQFFLTIVGHTQMQSILKNQSINHGLVRIEGRLDKMEARIMAPSTPLIANSDLVQSLLGTQRNSDTAIAAPGSAAHIRRQYVLFHKSGCLLHAPGRRTINLVMKRTICNCLLGFSVLASLQITTGTGGFTISPKLVFRPVVPEDSPAFILLRSVRPRFKEDSNRSVIRNVNRRLFELFREGKASPSDTLADGRTILHVAWRRFINDLLDTGLSPSQIDYRGTTPADNMIDLYETDWDGHGEPPGGHMTNNALDWRHHPNTFDLAYYMSPLRLFEDHTVRLVWLLEDSRELQDIDLPDELVPLITRSKDQLLLLLKNGYDMQRWFDSYAQWPTGLCLLLQAGYNPANCIASLQILINNRNFRLGRDELGVASLHYNKDIVQLTVQALVDRRKRLQSLAVACLPSEYIKVDDDIEEEYEWSVYDAVGNVLSIADRVWYAVRQLCTFWDAGLVTRSFVKDDEDVGPKLSCLDEECWALFRSILCDDTRDSCDCAYSVDGCCGLTRFSVTIDVAASCLELKPRESFYNQLAPEEAAEIHDEQKYLICTLERLVNELTVECEKSAEPLPEFLTGYCWKRINEAICGRYANSAGAGQALSNRSSILGVQ
ncbi:hypothetical protein BDW66DRAFT_168434 [Aspergillus desertorum]